MVQILDATLREGEQTPKIYFPCHIKLAIAELLDKIGINVIESGHPRVTEDIRKAVQTLANRQLHATIGAHARSVKDDIDLAIDCGVQFLGIFYCVSNDRLTGVFKKDLQQAIQQITECIKYAKQKNPNIIIRYTPEDTVRSKFDNVVQAAVAAVKAGADIISIADTTGYMIPGTKRNMYDYVTKLKTALAEQDCHPKIAVHCHNDRGFALANALDAYRAGAEIIDTTVLGLGERAGIVDLATLMTILKNDFNEGENWDLTLLPQLYELVSQYANVPIPVNQPITGANAFTHCAGVHTQAAAKDPMHYESLPPALVGRERSFSLDHMSGLASIKHGLEKIGEPTDDKTFMLQVLEKVKSIGETGRTVDLDELRDIVNWCKHHNGA